MIAVDEDGGRREKSSSGATVEAAAGGVRVEEYLGVTEGRGGRGGALHKLTGDRASSSIGQTICGSGSEGLVNIPSHRLSVRPSVCQWTVKHRAIK